MTGTKELIAVPGDAGRTEDNDTGGIGDHIRMALESPAGGCQRECLLPEIQPADVENRKIAAERRFVQSESSRNDEADAVFRKCNGSRGGAEPARSRP